MESNSRKVGRPKRQTPVKIISAQVSIPQWEWIVAFGNGNVSAAIQELIQRQIILSQM